MSGDAADITMLTDWNVHGDDSQMGVYPVSCCSSLQVAQIFYNFLIGVVFFSHFLHLFHREQVPMARRADDLQSFCRVPVNLHIGLLNFVAPPAHEGLQRTVLVHNCTFGIEFTIQVLPREGLKLLQELHRFVPLLADVRRQDAHQVALLVVLVLDHVAGGQKRRRRGERNGSEKGSANGNANGSAK